MSGMTLLVMFFAYSHCKNLQGWFGENCWKSKDCTKVFEGWREPKLVENRKKTKTRKSLPPQLIVGAGGLTAGLRKGGKESLPSD